MREYLKQGNNQRKAVEMAVNECLEKDVLADILIKHRAEVMDMFLTKFDKKMYEEAIREEGLEQGREEVLESMAKRLRDSGYSIEEARELMPEYDLEKLERVYGEIRR